MQLQFKMCRPFVLCEFDKLSGSRHPFSKQNKVYRYIEVPRVPKMSSTAQSSKQSISIRGSAQMVAEFFNFSVNSILYQRGVYDPGRHV
jgi:hypothetical protein